jgi:hypothetical protein
MECPLVIDGRTARSLEQEYQTNAEDRTVAMSGAWKLRRDLMRRGYDSVIAVDGPDRLKIVQLCRSISKTNLTRGDVITLHQEQSRELNYSTTGAVRSLAPG